MKAIVLTFDKQVGFAELAYKKYMELWPDCPLTFRIPYNSEKKCQSYDYFKSKDNVELIRTPSPIRDTMSLMLNDIDDEEWVFWCIDDRYPVRNIENTYNVNKCLNVIYNKINSDGLSGLNRVKIASKIEDNILYGENDETTRASLKIGDIEFFKENEKLKNFGGAYCHAFIRSKILKYYFLRDEMPKQYGIRKFHSLNVRLSSKNFPWEDNHSSIILKNHILSFGEPAIFGALTMNGLVDLQRYGCPIPEYDMVLCTRLIMDKRIDRRRVYNYRVKKIGNISLPMISLIK